MSKSSSQQGSTPQGKRLGAGANPRYAHAEQSGTHTSGEQYFSSAPSSDDRRRNITVTLRGHEVRAGISNGVFSASGLDKGTAVLLKLAPEPPHSGSFLDLGCGWGPIALSLALESPSAHVWALDVNQRALELTRSNAENLGITSITACTAEELPPAQTFDLIWSNPPIRVGKKILHELLMTYLTRLNVGGVAYLVVQKHLGADSLIPWLQDALGSAYKVSRYDSSKGFRVIEIRYSNQSNTVDLNDSVANTEDISA